jgi:hypothetical protein
LADPAVKNGRRIEKPSDFCESQVDRYAYFMYTPARVFNSVEG